MNKEKVTLTILGLIPTAFALGAFWFATILYTKIPAIGESGNAPMQGMVYMGMGMLGLIGLSMLYAAYRIFAYMQNR